jgi:potassium voltage-gated channel Shab-related subfamily B protein 1
MGSLQDLPLCSRDIVCRYQKELWDLIEHPDASTAAHIVSYISMMFVVVSTIGMSLNTMPGLKVFNHWLNMKVDLQSLFGLHAT